MIEFQTPRAEQEIFDELELLCASPGYIHALAYMSFRDNVIAHAGQLTSDILASSYDADRTVRTEFSTLLGLMMKHVIDFTLPSPNEMQGLLDRTRDLLDELHASFNEPMAAALVKAANEAASGVAIEDATPFLRGEVLREPIFYGGESAYSFQYSDFAVERYAQDDDWLLAKKGFCIRDARSVVEALNSVANRKLQNVIDGLRHVPPAEWSLLPGFTLSLTEIAEEAIVDPDSVASALAAFTAPAAPTNTAFQSVGDFNLANACPIIRNPDGEYISLQAYGVVEALYDSPFYWMASDKGYRDTASIHRGAFTEELVAKRLSSVFGEGNVHRSVNVVRQGNRLTEADILVLYANRAIVVQCKSKKLTLEARKGNDLQIRNDFKMAIQDAYDQAKLCAKSLIDPALSFIRQDGVQLAIPDLREIYPVCVVSDHYPALAAQVRQFLNFESDEIVQAPFVGDVFVIDVLAEMLRSPLRFLSYIHRRVGYADRINSFSELTILGYHLQQNLWLDNETGLVTILDDFSLALDTAMAVRRLNVPGDKTPEGILTRLDGTVVGRLLKNIEGRADPSLIDLGFLLLSLGGETLDDLNLGIERITKQTRADGKVHDLTLVFNDSKNGLTIHCSRDNNALAATRLADHCRLRKYIHRADNWFGLSVRSDDGLPKFGIELRFPWTRDAKMEAETRGVQSKANFTPGGSPIPTNIGRNEPCPCGSGKKFKKCCRP